MEAARAARRTAMAYSRGSSTPASFGEHDAFFSTDDDKSDGNGIYLAGVIGKCSSMNGQTLVFRMVIHGQFFPVRLVFKEDMFWFGIK